MAITNSEAAEIGKSIANALLAESRRTGSLGALSSKPESKTTTSKDSGGGGGVTDKFLAKRRATREDKAQRHQQKIFNSVGQSTSKFVRDIRTSAVDVQSLGTAIRDLENLKGVTDLMTDYRTGGVAFADLKQSVIDMGYSSERTSYILKGLQQEVDMSTGRMKKSAKATTLVNTRIHNLGIATKQGEEVLLRHSNAVEADTRANNLAAERDRKLSNGAIKAGKEVIKILGLSADEFSTMYKYGTSVLLKDATARGMNSEAWGSMISKNVAASTSLAGGFDEFREIVSVKATAAMVGFTGSMPEAAKMLTSLTNTSRLLGDENVNSASFVKQQAAQFKTMNTVLHTTSEEYAAMNAALMSNTENRVAMVRMDKAQRVAHHQNMIALTKEYQLRGLSNEQSAKFITAMQSMTNAMPKDKVKSAAKMRAAMGAFGLQGGAELQQLMQKGSLTVSEEARKAELIKPLADAVQSGLGSNNLGVSLRTGAVVESTGIKAIVDEFRNLQLSSGARVSSKAQQEGLANQERMLVGVGSVVARDIAKTIGDGPIGTGINSLKTIAEGLAPWFVAAGVALATTATATTANAATSVSILSATRAGKVGVVAAAGYAAGTALNNAIETHAPEAHEDMTDKLGWFISKIIDSDEDFRAKEQALIDRRQADLLIESRKQTEATERQTEAIVEQTAIAISTSKEVKRTTAAIKEASAKQTEEAKETMKSVQERLRMTKLTHIGNTP